MPNIKKLDPDKLENARIGYETAINLFIFEGQMLWSRFNTILAVNTVIISILVLLPKKVLNQICP
jgi:hypothetical protein